MAAVLPIKKEDLGTILPTPEPRATAPVVHPIPFATTAMAGRIVTDETAAVKKKKKKKKDPVKQQALAQQLGAAFPASAAAGIAAAAPKPSFFRSPDAPRLDASDQVLLTTLFERWSPCDNMNLFDLFMADFEDSWKQLLQMAEPVDGDVYKFLSNVHGKSNVVSTIFMTYLSQHGLSGDYAADIEENYHTEFLRPVPELIQWLTQYLEALDLFSKTTKSQCDARVQNKSPAAQRLIKNKYAPLIEQIKLLDLKTRLLTKCLQVENPVSLLVVRKCSDWSESCRIEAVEQIQIESLQRFSAFVGSFVKNAFEHGAISVNLDFFAPFSVALQKMIDSRFSKRSTAEFLTEYKRMSATLLNLRIDFSKRLDRAKKDPSYTHAGYCEEMKIPRKHNRNQKEFVSFMLNVNLSLYLIDKWVNDLNETLTHHFLADLEGDYFRAPKSYIDRLKMTVDLVQIVQIPPLPLSEDSFLRHMDAHIAASVARPTDYLSKLFERFDLPYIARCLEQASSASSFHLSDCQLAVIPISNAAANLDPLLSDLDTIRRTCLATIQRAKEAHELDKWDPQVLKAKIQESLFNQSMMMCAYIMALSDAKQLFSASYANDVLHLLPTEMINFLTLEGFDAIFAPEPVVVVEEQLQLPPAPPAEPEPPLPAFSAAAAAIPPPKPKPILKPAPTRVLDMPGKRDFVETTKRGVIVRMLEQMKYTFERYGKGSHEIYRHPETSGIVVVPKDVSKTGLRAGLYDQAVQGAKRAQEKKKED